jgi:hypothetical protein
VRVLECARRVRPRGRLAGIGLDLELALGRSVSLMPLPRALRHRDYAMLWSGQTVSVVGDGVYTVAIALEALRISDHASALAYVEAARVAPNALLLLFTGALTDRLPRRLVVLGANIARAAAVAALALLEDHFSGLHGRAGLAGRGGGWVPRLAGRHGASVRAHRSPGARPGPGQGRGVGRGGVRPGRRSAAAVAGPA